MSKILFVRCNTNPVNLNSYNIQYIGMAKFYCSIGYDCDIVFYSKENLPEKILYKNQNHIVKLIYMKGRQYWRQAIYPQLLCSNILDGYDYVITNEYRHAMSLKLVKQNTTAKIIVYDGPYYNLDKIKPLSYFRDLIYVPQYKNHAKYIASKSVLAADYLKKKGITNAKVVGVGLDYSVFEFETEVSSKTQHVLDFMGNNKCILFVGQIIKRKDFLFVCKVFQNIHRQDSSIKLVVVGKGNWRNRLYVNKCKNILNSIGVNSYIWVDKIPNKELKEIYKNAKIFMMPSKYEIFGMVLLEAMYFGVPVFTTVNGGSLTCIKDNENGFILDNNNVEEWSGRIISLLNNDEYYDAVSCNAKATIVNNFGWDTVGQHILDICDNG